MTDNPKNLRSPQSKDDFLAKLNMFKQQSVMSTPIAPSPPIVYPVKPFAVQRNTSVKLTGGSILKPGTATTDAVNHDKRKSFVSGQALEGSLKSRNSSESSSPQSFSSSESKGFMRNLPSINHNNGTKGDSALHSYNHDIAMDNFIEKDIDLNNISSANNLTECQILHTANLDELKQNENSTAHEENSDLVENVKFHSPIRRTRKPSGTFLENYACILEELSISISDAENSENSDSEDIFKTNAEEIIKKESEDGRKIDIESRNVETTQKNFPKSGLSQMKRRPSRQFLETSFSNHQCTDLNIEIEHEDLEIVSPVSELQKQSETKEITNEKAEESIPKSKSRPRGFSMIPAGFIPGAVKLRSIGSIKNVMDQPEKDIISNPKPENYVEEKKSPLDDTVLEAKPALPPKYHRMTMMVTLESARSEPSIKFPSSPPLDQIPSAGIKNDSKPKNLLTIERTHQLTEAKSEPIEPLTNDSILNANGKKKTLKKMFGFLKKGKEKQRPQQNASDTEEIKKNDAVLLDSMDHLSPINTRNDEIMHELDSVVDRYSHERKKSIIPPKSQVQLSNADSPVSSNSSIQSAPTKPTNNPSSKKLEPQIDLKKYATLLYEKLLPKTTEENDHFLKSSSVYSLKNVWSLLDASGRELSIADLLGYGLYSEEYLLIAAKDLRWTATNSNNGSSSQFKLWIWQGFNSVPSAENAMTLCSISQEKSSFLERIKEKYSVNQIDIIRQGKETPDFLTLFGNELIVRLGSRSKLTNNGLNNNQSTLKRRMTFSTNLANDPVRSLFKVQKVSNDIFRVWEVDPTLTNIDSNHTFIVSGKSGNLGIWYGKGSTIAEKDHARKILLKKFNNPKNLLEIFEGEEPKKFFERFSSNSLGNSFDFFTVMPSELVQLKNRGSEIVESYPWLGIRILKIRLIPAQEQSLNGNNFHIEMIHSPIQDDLDPTDEDHVYVVDPIYWLNEDLYCEADELILSPYLYTWIPDGSKRKLVQLKSTLEVLSKVFRKYCLSNLKAIVIFCGSEPPAFKALFTQWSNNAASINIGTNSRSTLKNDTLTVKKKNLVQVKNISNLLKSFGGVYEDLKSAITALEKLIELDDPRISPEFKRYSKFYKLEELQNYGRLPVTIVLSKLENYLSDADFDANIRMSREEFQQLTLNEKERIKKELGIWHY